MSWCLKPVPGRVFSTRCRKCASCLKLRQENWTERSVWEILSADKAVWLTLTYRRKPKDGYQEFQRYAKRLRITLQRQYGKGSRLRFVVASEFGERKGRYHLHGILCIYGCNPPVHFVRRKWSSGITHARKIKTGDSRRIGRYISKYLAKAGRIRASNGWGTSAQTQERIMTNAGPIAAAIAQAFPGAQVVGYREEKGARTERAPYALRKRFLRDRNVRVDFPRQRPLGGLEALQSRSSPYDDIWGDYLHLNSVAAWNAQADYQLRLIGAVHPESEVAEEEA